MKLRRIIQCIAVNGLILMFSTQAIAYDEGFPCNFWWSSDLCDYISDELANSQLIEVYRDID